MKVYLDNHANTPLGPAAVAAMQGWFQGRAGNPHALAHQAGQEAAQVVEAARSAILQLLGLDYGRVVFTSGATEANNLAIIGAARWRLQHHGRDEIVISSLEHPSVTEAAAMLAANGMKVKVIPIRRSGKLNLQHLSEQLNDKTAVVSIIHGHNEIGTIQPISEIAAICAEHEAWLHSDMTQSAWITAADVVQPYPGSISLSAHKMYGPPGIGALWFDDDLVNLSARSYGGGQEGGIRSGTLPTMLIAGFAAAATEANNRRARDARQLIALRNQFWQDLIAICPSLILNGDLAVRLPHNLHFSVPGVFCDEIMPLLVDQLAISNGSSCQAQGEFSNIFAALGYSASDKLCGIRIGLGRDINGADLAFALQHFGQAFRKLGLIA